MQKENNRDLFLHLKNSSPLLLLFKNQKQFLPHILSNHQKPLEEIKVQDLTNIGGGIVTQQETKMINIESSPSSPSLPITPENNNNNNIGGDIFSQQETKTTNIEATPSSNFSSK